MTYFYGMVLGRLIFLLSMSAPKMVKVYDLLKKGDEEVAVGGLSRIDC